MKEKKNFLATLFGGGCGCGCGINITEEETSRETVPRKNVRKKKLAKKGCCNMQIIEENDNNA